MERDNYPSGILTFLFTDIQGSTPLWEKDPAGMGEALELHNVALSGAIEGHGGRLFKIIGDEFQVVFEDPLQAIIAAVAGQRALSTVKWGRVGPLSVRMGLHFGPATWEGTDYMVSHTFNRTARIMSCGHGGQILLSVEVVDQVGQHLPQGVTLRDMGRLSLKGMTLREHLFQVIAPGLEKNFPPLKTVGNGPKAIPNNLPLASTPFIGRDQELAELDALISDPEVRLVTIVGPGGMGKTRLALAAAEKQLGIANGHKSHFPNGIFFVALEALDSAEQIPAALNKALGFRPAAEEDDPAGRSPWQQTLDYLRSKHMLLVMDNFEQLLEGTTLVAGLHETARKVKVLATSREKLAMRGEHLFPLQGMPHPERMPVDMDSSALLENYAAPRLFVQSARRLRPDFGVTADDVSELGHICHLVDGMPLALELAAGWAELLSLADIASEISASIDVLDTELSDVPQRQRSMTAVFEGSWQRLGDDEQTVLKKLSVFRGGFTREAARQVTGASLRQLATLAGKSLIQYDKGRDRYQIHRLLRQYLAGRLAQDTEIESAARDRHAAFFCAALGVWAEDLKGDRQRKAMVEMEADSNNIETAWSWAATERKISQLDAGIEGLVLFYARSGRTQEVERACQQASDRLSGTTNENEQRVLARILVRQGWFIPDEQDAKLVRKSLGLLASLEQKGRNVQREQALCFERLGSLMILKDNETAGQLLARSLTFYEMQNDKWGEATTLSRQAMLVFWQGLFDDAQRLLKKSLICREKIDDRTGRTKALVLLAIIADYQGDGDEALALEEESIRIFEEDQNLIGLADALRKRSYTLYFGGRFEEASIVLLKSIEQSNELGLSSADDELLLDVHEIMRGHYEVTNKYYPFDEAYIEEWGITGGYLLLYLGLVAIAEKRYFEGCQLVEQTVRKYQDQKRSVDIDAAFSCRALALNYMGKMAEAVSQLQEGMRINLVTRSVFSLIYILPAAAAILAGLGRTERAVEVYELARQYPHVANSPLFEDIAGKRITAAAASFPVEKVENARERGRDLEPWQTLEDLLGELRELKHTSE